MKKNFRLLFPILVSIIVLSNISCGKIGIITFEPNGSISVDVNATNAESFTREKSGTNTVKSTLASKNIDKNNVKAVELLKVVATIPASSAMDFSDIESATVFVNGIEWAKLPANASTKTVEFVVSVTDVRNIALENETLNYKYVSKTKKATPATTINFDFTYKIDYQAL